MEIEDNKVYLNGIPFLLDTGAAISAVEELPSEAIYTRSVALRLANGNIEVHKLYEIPFILGECEFSLEVAKLSRNILGMNVLHSAVIDFRNSTLTISCSSLN